MNKNNKSINTKHDLFEQDFNFMKWYQDKMIENKHNLRNL